MDNEGAEEEDAEVDGVGEDDFESDDFDDFEEDTFDEDEFEEDDVDDFAFRVYAVEEDEAGERHQRTKISSGQRNGSTKMAGSSHSHVM